MTKLIGWTFVLLNPFMGVPLGLCFVYHLLTGRPWEIVYISITGLWVLFYCLWFDGSKYQRGLL